LMDVEDAILADFVDYDKILELSLWYLGYIEIDQKRPFKKIFNKGKDLMLLEIGSSIEL
jgi:hypothetical protein